MGQVMQVMCVCSTRSGVRFGPRTPGAVSLPARHLPDCTNVFLYVIDSTKYLKYSFLGGYVYTIKKNEFRYSRLIST